MPRSSVVARGTSSGITSSVAVPRPPADDVFDERPHRDADDRLAGFVHHRAGDDGVLPHTELDVREPLPLGERNELALAPGPALAVAPWRKAVLRGLHEVLARRQVRKEKAAFVVSHDATLRRCRQVLEILRHRQSDDSLIHRDAGDGVHDLADDQPGALAGRSAIGGDDLRGTPNRQGEHDGDRRDPAQGSQPSLAIEGWLAEAASPRRRTSHGGFRIIRMAAALHLTFRSIPRRLLCVRVLREWQGAEGSRAEWRC